MQSEIEIEIEIGQGDFDECLVNGILFQFRCGFPDDVHDASGHVCIEFVVAGEEDDTMGFFQGFDLEIGCAHGDAERLEFGGAGDDAAVVIAEDGNGLSGEARVEDAFAGNEEIVAVDKSEHVEVIGIRGWLRSRRRR